MSELNTGFSSITTFLKVSTANVVFPGNEARGCVSDTLPGTKFKEPGARSQD